MDNRTKTLLARFLAEKFICSGEISPEIVHHWLGEFEVRLRDRQARQKTEEAFKDKQWADL